MSQQTTITFPFTPPKAYHNTNRLKGANLQQQNQKAATHQQQVLQFFIKHPFQKFTPIQVHQALNSTALITSTRRAITNLTTAGILTKTKEKIKEIYGNHNFLWMLTNRTELK